MPVLRVLIAKWVINVLRTAFCNILKSQNLFSRINCRGIYSHFMYYRVMNIICDFAIVLNEKEKHCHQTRFSLFLLPHRGSSKVTNHLDIRLLLTLWPDLESSNQRACITKVCPFHDTIVFPLKLIQILMLVLVHFYKGQFFNVWSGQLISTSRYYLLVLVRRLLYKPWKPGSQRIYRG